MHWKVQYNWKLYRTTGKKPEGLEQCISSAVSIKQAKKDTDRLMPHQLKELNWRKVGPHTYRKSSRESYFRVDLEIIGWVPPRWEPKPSLNPKIQELRDKRNAENKIR